MQMRRPKSDIPANAVERCAGSTDGGEIRQYLVRGKVVGQRWFDEHGHLLVETPLRNDNKHGREISWNEDGSLSLVEPYCDGKIHGTARQYGAKGRVVGTYKMVHGTGFDVWRDQFAGGPVYVSEIHSLRDGVLHGFIWWLNEDQTSVFEEYHWHNGQPHGIERSWNSFGKLRRSCPKYWVGSQAVTKRQYLAASRKDPTLPPFRLKDNRPQRDFPPEIRRILKSRTKD